MSSFVNKLASSITNSTGSLIGRDNLAKLSNSINKVISKSKYRDYLKAGNIVQLVSKTSKKSVQVCSSNENQNNLLIYGDGPIGPEFTFAHFKIEQDPKKGHYKFVNGINYLAFDIDFACVLNEPAQKPKHKHELMRGRNEFRLHEILGSEEYFALESAYSPGRYLAVMPDGTLAYSRNKADVVTHFCLAVIYVLPQNLPPNARNPSIPIANTTGTAIDPNSNRASSFSIVDDRYPEEREIFGAESETKSQTEVDTPPTYTMLYPQLPKQ